MENIYGIDIFIGVVLVVSALLSFSRGFISEMLGIGSWFVALIVAFYAMPYLEPFVLNYVPKPLFANVLSLVVVSIVTLIVLTLICSKIETKVRKSVLNRLDHFLGFIFGWLGLICAQEYLLPCFVTFAMFCLLEFCLCLFRKITLQPQYRELPYNSAAVQSFNDGLPADTLLHIIWSTEVLLLIFGLLQVNSENSFSIPSFAAVIVAWQMYRLSHWQLASQTLKETNSALINEIKQGFGKIFSSAPDGKDKNDKTDKS